MDRPSIDRFVERMFRARRIVLQAVGVLAILLIAGSVAEYTQVLAERAQFTLLAIPILLVFLVVAVGMVVALSVVSIGSLVVWYYVFRAGMRGIGPGYAVGHLLLCIILTYLFLLGVILVPLMVRSDLERQELIRRHDGDW